MRPQGWCLLLLRQPRSQRRAGNGIPGAAGRAPEQTKAAAEAAGQRGGLPPPPALSGAPGPRLPANARGEATAQTRRRTRRGLAPHAAGRGGNLSRPEPRRSRAAVPAAARRPLAPPPHLWRGAARRGVARPRAAPALTPEEGEELRSRHQAERVDGAQVQQPHQHHVAPDDGLPGARLAARRPPGRGHLAGGALEAAAAAATTAAAQRGRRAARGGRAAPPHLLLLPPPPPPPWSSRTPAGD